MSFITKILVRRLQWIAVFAVAALLIGCEGDSGSHIWDGFDFWVNDPDIYVAMGDSITAGYGLSSYSDAYPVKLSAMLGKTVVNKGVIGNYSSYGADTVKSVLSSYRPGCLLILYGANDLIMEYSIDSVINNLHAMIVAAKNNHTIPVIATLTPVFASHLFIKNNLIALNERIRQLADEQEVHVADLENAFDWSTIYISADGLHPNSAGQNLIAVVFYEVLE